MSMEDRKKAVQAAMDKINKNMGQGSISRLGDAPLVEIEALPTGSLVVDMAIGIGGLPKGKIVEIYGPESSGKTLLCLHAIAEVQKNGGVAAFIDAENAFNTDWAAKIGVNIDDLIFSQPDSGEDAFNIAETLAASGAVDLIVIDSVSALVPRKELEGETGDTQVGTQAKMMSQGLRKITGVANKTGTTIIFINQLRMKIGVMFGSPETTSGGNALKFFASLRMDIRRIAQLKNGEEVYGARTKVKIIKNKVGAPFKTAEFDVLFTEGSEGFSKEADIRDLGVTLDLIKKSGSWFTYTTDKGENIQVGQGAEKARLFLQDPENAEIRDEIERKIKELVFTGKGKLETVREDLPARVAEPDAPQA
jgi:recombination protein RecA